MGLFGRLFRGALGGGDLGAFGVAGGLYLLGTLIEAVEEIAAIEEEYQEYEEYYEDEEYE